jgi:hypothetical protein
MEGFRADLLSRSAQPVNPGVLSALDSERKLMVLIIILTILAALLSIGALILLTKSKNRDEL